MEPKRHFESVNDVEAYFEAQIELWDEPKPQPPNNLWERIERDRLLNERRSVSAHHQIARPDFSRLQFPKVEREPRTYRVKTLFRIAKVPRARARPQTRHKLKRISSFRRFLRKRELISIREARSPPIGTRLGET